MTKKFTAAIASALLVAASSSAVAQTSNAAQKLSIAGQSDRAGVSLEGASELRGRGGDAAVVFPLLVGLVLIAAFILFDEDEVEEDDDASESP